MVVLCLPLSPRSLPALTSAQGIYVPEERIFWHQVLWNMLLSAERKNRELLSSEWKMLFPGKSPERKDTSMVIICFFLWTLTELFHTSIAVFIIFLLLFYSLFSYDILDSRRQSLSFAHFHISQTHTKSSACQIVGTYKTLVEWMNK